MDPRGSHVLPQNIVVPANEVIQPQLHDPWPTLACPPPVGSTTAVKKVTLKLGKPPSESLEGGSMEDSPTKAQSFPTNNRTVNPQARASEMVTITENEHSPTTETNMDPQYHVTPDNESSPRINTNAIEDLLESPLNLTEVISLGDPSTDIHERLVNWYHDDPFFKKILDNPSAFKNFEVSNSRIFLKDNASHILCVLDITIVSRRVCEIIISHTHSILAHLGLHKTLLYLQENIW